MARTVRHLASATAALGLLAALPAAPAGAVPAVKGSKTIIRALNELRAQNGIPAGIKQRRRWSYDCFLHDRWMGRNGKVDHYEDPGTPGYSKGGAWAGPNSILSEGLLPFTTPAADPYADAPFHLLQQLHPRLDVMGAAWVGFLDCETTFPGYKRAHPKHDRVYAYPGDGTTIPWFEYAYEAGGVPGDLVGLPQGTATGQYLLVYTDGPQKPAPLTDVKRASLRGPDGRKVAVRVVDDRLAQGAFPGSGFVIPVHPLDPDTRYTARVEFAGHGARRTVHRSWKFTTEPLLTGSAAVKIKVTRAKSGYTIELVGLDKAYQGRTGVVSGRAGQDYSFSGGTLPIDDPNSVNSFTVPAPPDGEPLTITARVKPFDVGPRRVKGFTLTRTVGGG